jgi:hypothetical protein
MREKDRDQKRRRLAGVPGTVGPRGSFAARDKLERRATMNKTLIALLGVGVLASACTATGNTERNAAGGAALGALAGAIVGNNVGGGSATTGAAVGAALGGTVGAVKGCREDGGCGATNVNRRQYYDERAGRYYYYDSRSGRYYWEDGSPR